MSGLLLTLGLLSSVPVLAQDLETPPPTVLQAADGRLTIATPGSGWTPGVSVAVYLADLRPDPRSGEPVAGLRYGGDAQVSWVGPDFIELVLDHPATVDPGTLVRLGDPLGGAPTPVWTPPVAAAPAVVTAPAPGVPDPPWVSFSATTLDGTALGSVHDSPPDQPQSLALEGSFIGDGYDTGAGWGAVVWAVQPRQGPGRVEVRLEGLRGERWVQGKDSEPWSTEPAVGYWLLTRVDSPGVGLGAFGVLGVGVDDVGPAVALGLGVRTGHPDRTRLALSWDGRGRMGNRLTLDGRVALSDGSRLGLRARAGTLPLHQGDFLQWRADGALVVDTVVAGRWTLQGAIGAGGYDLPWRDLGLVADGRLEVRW